MAPSTSSFLDLKAQISKQEAEFAQSRAIGKEMLVKGGVHRQDKKPTIWARPNKGVILRNLRDLEWSQTSRPILDAAKDALERKAILYEKLRKGKTAGLSEKQYESLLVDFDQKAEEHSDGGEDVDESLTVPQRPDEDDPIVEYEDEFGRVRSARRSEVPRGSWNLSVRDEDNVEDDPYLIYGDSDYFPTYEQSTEKIAAVKAAVEEDANPAIHYDATQEVRARAAGFYQFSKDEETRRKQMEELKRTREETEKARDNSASLLGEEKRPGLEKRKREIEERRKAVEAKRRKIDIGDTPGKIISEQTIGASTESKDASKQPVADLKKSADEFLAALERDIITARRGKLS